MPEIRPPKHLRPRRQKIYGAAPGVPLDRNARTRIVVAARAYNHKHKQPGQHWGPLTRATIDVLKTLLWGFCHEKTGQCFPSYEKIAATARCDRKTVYEAIKALEAADLLTWVNRIYREQVKERDLFGRLATRWRMVRTSNAYSFRDPLPCQPFREKSSKWENLPGIPKLDFTSKTEPVEPPKIIILDPQKGLDAALIRLGRTIGALPMAEG